MVTMKHFHGRDLRIGRVSETERPYLVTTVTQNRQPLFCDWRVGRLLVAELHTATQAGYADTLAWVIMPDHLHWLMSPATDTLDTVMRRIKSRSAQSIHRHRGTTGALWQKGYHDHAVRKNEDIRTIARYIISNPLRAGLVKSIGDYPLWDAIWL
jgi:REP element-mobilizing transposase RayT